MGHKPNHRKVVRVNGPGANGPTPFLRKWGTSIITNLTRPARIVDIGCGDGRNSEYLINCTPETPFVLALDMQPDYFNALRIPWFAGKDRIPLAPLNADLVLLQYVLMFLSDEEISHVLTEASVATSVGGYLIVELQDVKSGRKVRINRVEEFMTTLRDRNPDTHSNSVLFGNWVVVRREKNRLLMRKHVVF